jgi:hypothetical protein
MKMGSISVVVIAVLVIGFGGHAYKKHQEKQKNIEEAEQVLAELKNLEQPYNDFIEQSRLASATPRIQLSPVVARMQDTLKIVTGMHSSGCAMGVQLNLRQSIESMRDGFLSFMSHDDIKSDAQTSVATSKISEYQTSAEACAIVMKKRLEDLQK